MRRRDLLASAVGVAAGAAGLPTLSQAAPAAAEETDAWTPAPQVMEGLQRIVTPNGVQETLTLPIGGLPQVVNVRGADRRNPILLFVHGGPGAVEMPIAWTFQRPWEDLFTCVQWDQRGAGRTYRLSDPAVVGPTLSRDRIRDDCVELIEQLLRRYGGRKVVLLGHSWGSAVGLSAAFARPDLLHAYVGVGQIIDARENERRGYAWTLAEARRRGDADAVRELEALRPYPADGPLSLEKVDVERRWNVRYGGLAWGRSDADFYFQAARLSPLYGPADRRAWNAGSALSMSRLWPALADLSFQDQRSLATPTFMFLGRNDWTTPSSVAAEWLDRLQAPAKAVAWFEHSAHLPFIEEPGRFFAALLQHVMPLTQEG